MKYQSERKITQVEVVLRGITPYSQSKYMDLDLKEYKKEPREKTQDYDERLWKEKAHWNKDGHMYVPRRQMRVMMANAAQYKGMKVEGQGQAKYTKHFKAGILITKDFSLVNHEGQPVTRENVGIDISFPETSTGNRVKTRSPLVHNGWKTMGTMYITDPTITKNVFLEHLSDAGMFIGLGRFRIGNGGDFGSFVIEDYEFIEVNNAS